MRRMLTMDEVADVLNVSRSQVRALLVSRDLPGAKIGGRGVWRVDPAELERSIAAQHERTRDELHEPSTTVPT